MPQHYQPYSNDREFMKREGEPCRQCLYPFLEHHNGQCPKESNHLMKTVSQRMLEQEKLHNRTCALCGAVISLAKTGPVGFKWVTDLKKPKNTWRCLPTKEYPVRAHSPKGGN